VLPIDRLEPACCFSLVLGDVNPEDRSKVNESYGDSNMKRTTHTPLAEGINEGVNG